MFLQNKEVPACLPKYRSICPQCGGKDLKVKYCSKSSELGREHLACRCVGKGCGYKWAASPATHGPVSLAQSSKELTSGTALKFVLTFELAFILIKLIIGFLLTGEFQLN